MIPVYNDGVKKIQANKREGRAMNCCHEDHSKEGKAPQKHRRLHSWLMIVGCVLPIVLVAVILFTGIDLGTWGNYLPILLVLICPLMHLVMMPLMMGKRKHRH
ncbi:DUF2933 domain-containing protein [Paenibacillus antri]|uniref:DUF2933 domain-containing protein n=1 Tax=Paenibacillus antri TaxID=2582848 RepID=A0A5R9G4L8_9BACL|nr:DUF2933 domain-containing protein [Paenibacillus antri]